MNQEAVKTHMRTTTTTDVDVKATRATRRRGRRSPVATVALVAIGLLFTGGAYAAMTATSTASADSNLSSAQNIATGKKLF